MATKPAPAAKKAAPAAKKAAPAAKKAAPAAKKAAPAAKKAAPTPAKKAAAPAPAPVEELAEGVAIDVGDQIRFIGYGPDVPEDQQFLTVDEVYTVSGFTEANPDEGDEGGDVVVTIENPSFNPKKRETAENPKTFEVSLYPEEYEVLEAEEVAEEVAEVEEAPAPTTGKGKKAAAAAAPATTAKKAPPAAKKAPKAAAVEAEEVEEADPDAMPDLEGEDEQVLELVNGEGVDLIAAAQEIEATAAASEYRMGGILFHIKKNKAHHNIEGGEAYKERGGFEKFLDDFFNIGYRKAQHLINIYIAFTQAGIENAAERVAQMGWAKAAKIAKPMQEEGAKVDDLLELADSNTVTDLTTVLQEQVRVGADTRPVVRRTTMKFRFDESEAAGITAILESVKSGQGLVSLDAALLYIVDEWAASNGVGKAPAAVAPTARTAPAAKKATAKA